MAALALYFDHGQLLADTGGGWDTILAEASDDPDDRRILRRCIATAHRVIRAHHDAKRNQGDRSSGWRSMRGRG